MELPKNITQIGEVGGACKIYVEDYVVSYMKQLNEVAGDKEMAVALYGRYTEEDGVSYYFLYGACKLDFLQQEVRHLSQAQQQEIEKLREKHFPEYQFLGYRYLNGEMIEGFHICEQDICRYIEGYFQFYEKNDSMLNYMLMVRPEVSPELFDQGKYDEVKLRQEERRAENMLKERGVVWAKKKAESMTGLQKMRFASVAVFALLCLAGVMSVQRNLENLEETDAAQGAQPVFATGVQTEADKLSQNTPAEGRVPGDRLVMEERLEQAVLQENQASANASAETVQPGSVPTESAKPGTAQSGSTKPEVVQQGNSQPEKPISDKSQSGGTGSAGSSQIDGNNGTGQSRPAVETKPTPAPTAEIKPISAPTATSAPTAAPVNASAGNVSQTDSVAYIVRKGDTLIGISMRQYGVETRVSDICSLNHISNPDDIKQGQILMLPR